MSLCVDKLPAGPHLGFNNINLYNAEDLNHTSIQWPLLVLGCNIIIIFTNTKTWLQSHTQQMEGTSLFLSLGKASLTETQSYQSASDQTFGHQ